MQGSFKQCALAGCVSVMVGGCATQQNTAPEYRLSSSVPAAVSGASMLQRGRAQLDAGLDAIAIESFRAEIRQNPESAEAYNGLAVAYGRIGRDDLAQRYFETALAKDPANAKAQTNLAKLTGDPAPVMQLAVLGAPITAIEPIAVTVADEGDPIGRILNELQTPSLVLVQLPSDSAPYDRSRAALAAQGVLSTRFAIAPARIATRAVTTAIKQAPFRESPAQPPAMPAPRLPTANLLPDYRIAGTRLERVSLGEVCLITRSEPPATPVRSARNFASFGERLAGWLPQSLAAERAGSSRRAIENSVIMAAIHRAEKGQKLAAAQNLPIIELPEFAYFSFDDKTDVDHV